MEEYKMIISTKITMDIECDEDKVKDIEAYIRATIKDMVDDIHKRQDTRIRHIKTNIKNEYMD